MPDPAAEQRHPAGDDPLWNESWYFDFAAPDGSIGGYVRVGLYPNLGVTWFWAYLVRPGQPLLAVRNHEAPLPKAGSLEVRDEGLWTHLICETPHEHWTIGLESFAVSLDDHRDALASERGDLVALGLDLEWEASAPAFDYPGGARYEQPCVVHGEVLIGDQRLPFDGTGERDHSWGRRDWWQFGWCWSSWHLEDGTAFHAMRPLVEDTRFQVGFNATNGILTPIRRFEVDTTYDGAGLPSAAAFMVDGERFAVTVAAHAPVPLVATDGRTGRLARALCRFEGADRAGWGWTEWNQPSELARGRQAGRTGGA